MTVMLEQLRGTLDAHALPYGVMRLKGGITLIVTQHGGRIFAFDDSDESLFWINPVLANATAFSDFLTAGGWNLGGERIWIAPEIQYIIQDRTDFWATHRLPTAIDPGNYTLTQTGAGWSLSQSLRLQAYNTAQGEKSLSVGRSIHTLLNPLRQLADYDALMRDMRFGGYAQTVTLSEENNAEYGASMFSESWNLVQLNPDGTLIIPVTAPPEVAPYFGTPTPDTLNAHDGALRIHITGKQQYKMGYKSAMVTGKLAYLKSTNATDGYLLIRAFDNNPSAIYAEEPPNSPGNHGNSVHVYNDGGDLGGFGEMEASGQTIGGDSGRTTSTDSFRMCIFTGDLTKLKRIGMLLLGRAV